MINSRENLVQFIQALVLDFHNDPDSWENNDISRFLVSLGAWVEDMNGYYLNKGDSVPQCPDWKNVGEMLLAAKIYE